MIRLGNASHLLFVQVTILGCAAFAWGQPTPLPAKVLTPEQKQYQAEISVWNGRRSELHTQAQNALNAEVAHEKAASCQDADSTRAIKECLGLEMQKTQSNYSEFAKAIRAILALSYPTMPGEHPVSGPTGMPLTSDELVKEFDNLEAQSKTYRDDASKAAYDQYRGGTLAPVFSLETEQRLLRLHLQEMAFVYGEQLSNH